LAHDHLRGNQLDHLGGVVADAHALPAAARACALGEWHRDRVRHAGQVSGSRLPGRRPLTRRLRPGLVVAFIDLGQLAQSSAGLATRIFGTGEEVAGLAAGDCVEEQHELRLGDCLALLVARQEILEPLPELAYTSGCCLLARKSFCGGRCILRGAGRQLAIARGQLSDQRSISSARLSASSSRATYVS
jgi:hypothetical protein